MAGDSESYLSLLEDNHWVMIKSVDPEVFLDYMRQHHVLSEEDCQTIQNYFVHHTRRARMRCFLGILRTKGPENIHLYFKQLGWEYPHVYREIFRQEPSPPPESYRQDKKSRLSCDLNELLTRGLTMKRVCNQKEDLANQIKDMEAMLKHQKNEIEDLEREHQRLRQFERDNQQIQERLRTVTAINDEIKEENRQFLHEIRTLTLELQKHSDKETTLQAQLDEMSQQIQEKSFELNRKSREESDLRSKFERVCRESLKFKRVNSSTNRPPRLVEQVTMAQHAAKQEDFQHQVEILMDDMKNLEETNHSLCDKLQYMQNLLDDEKHEHDQMHRRVCALEHDKNTVESRLNTSLQRIERYFNRIKELEEQKRKLEEERVHMQTKIWEMSWESEKQFEQLHKLETRYDQLQQHFEQLRQDHRYCQPSEPCGSRHHQLLPDMKVQPVVPCQPVHSTMTSPDIGIEDPFKPFTSFHATPEDHEVASTVSDVSSVSSYTFELVDTSDPSNEPTDLDTSLTAHSNEPTDLDTPLTARSNEVTYPDTSLTARSNEPTDPVDCAASPLEAGDSTVLGDFFIRSNVKEEGDPEQQNFAVQEGDILHVDHKGQERWKVTKVDRTTGKLLSNFQGSIANPESHHKNRTQQPIRRDKTGKAGSLDRKYAIRRATLKHQHSHVAAYTTVYPAKAARLLPVLLSCPQSAMKSILSCMEVMAQDWACIVSDGCIKSAMQLFSQTSKHYVLPWEVRSKDVQQYENSLYKFIIITVTLESHDALPTLRHLLGDPDLNMDFDQELKVLKERQEMVQRAGLNSETVIVAVGQNDREAFWDEVRNKVSQVQGQVFWLEKNPHHAED